MEAQRNHKLIYSSSPDRLTYLGHKRYNTRNERIFLSFLQQIFYGLYESKRSSWSKILLLLKSVQIPMEQDFTRVLEGQENVRTSKIEYGKQSSKCNRRKESKLEGWQKSGQNWVHTYLETKSSQLRLGWLYTRTSFAGGKENREIFKIRGGCAPC